MENNQNQNMTSHNTKYDELEARFVRKYNDEEGHLKGYDCSICKNKGWIAYLKYGAATFQKCKCVEIRNANKAATESGLGQLLGEYNFNNFVVYEEWQKPVKEKAISFANRKDGWFYIAGKPGTGKTHICTAIVSEFLKENIPCKYMMWRDEAPRIKALVNDQGYTRIVNPYKTIECLYIDDFLKGNVTIADMNLAYEIINARYNASLLTIISSEKSLQEIMELDEAVGSRIFQKAKNNMLILKNGKNWRMQ